MMVLREFFRLTHALKSPLNQIMWCCSVNPGALYRQTPAPFTCSMCRKAGNLVRN